MIKLDPLVVRKVQERYAKCIASDLSHPERFDGRRYIAPFEVYQGDYRDLEDLGIQVIDPSEIGYGPARAGDCLAFVMHMVGMRQRSQAWQRIAKLQPVDALEEATIVLYESYYNAIGRRLPEHVGIVHDRRIISKMGGDEDNAAGGPILKHDLGAMPYAFHPKSQESVARLLKHA
ncbi:MAG TPA: hypothetical protein VJH97_07445 [Candidatus Nanoarchaeia archaeon]|nr:hypothetical protein [Candidatus Nanoarchaeia archaeon]